MPTTTDPGQLLFGDRDIALAVQRLAGEILARHPNDTPAFVGIERRGVFLARRVAAELSRHKGEIPFGSLDISLYRDDLDGLKKVPELRGSHIPFDVDGASIVLFDDVLFTGRTIRAALEELLDFGRAARIELATLIDRGNRELPIQADYAALTHETRPNEYIRVRMTEQDQEDGIYLCRKD